MKHSKNLLLVMALSGMAVTSKAQSTIAGNALTGTAPTPTQFLGSSNNYDVTFRTNNAERMRLDVSGRLLYNTTIPLVSNTSTASVTFDAKANDFVMNGVSSAQGVRYYLTTKQSGNPATQEQVLGHSVPGIVANSIFSTSGIVWNNIDYNNYQSDFNIFMRTTVGLTTSQMPLSITQNSGMVGINSVNPQNRLEIRSLPSDPQPAGLRFTNLTSAATPVTNPGAGVLAVNANGDVIYVNNSSTAPSSPFIGNYCGESPLNALTANYQTPLNDHIMYYNGQGAMGQNAIALGLACGSPVTAKFNVLQLYNNPNTASSFTTTAGSFVNRDVANGPSPALIGIEGKCDFMQAIGKSVHTAGTFSASGAQDNYGVKAFARQGAGNGGLSVAGDFVATNTAGYTYGIRTSASGNGTNPTFAIYAQTSGIAANNKWAGYFQGDVNFAGSTYLSGVLWATSDNRFKKDIKKIEGVNDKIKRLSGYTYSFKTSEFEERNFPATEQIGLIAQEVKDVFPQLVTEDAKGFLAVNYQGMIPVLLEAMKEQQLEIEELKALVKSGVTAPANGGLSVTSVSSVELNDAQAIILEQNVPNPFAEQTTIAYYLTDDVQKAQILFYNADGKLINTSDLKVVAGKGQLNVFANDLSNGLYSYTLVVDGRVMETKRMVKNK